MNLKFCAQTYDMKCIGVTKNWMGACVCMCVWGGGLRYTTRTICHQFRDFHCSYSSA